MSVTRHSDGNGRGRICSSPARRRSPMPDRIVAILLVVALSTAYPSLALGDDAADRQLVESALREAREIITSELLGHHDIERLAVLDVEPLRPELLHRDYGLVIVSLAFSTKRNATRHPNLNPALFEPNSPMCQGWLYLHCAVPVGHVFDGKLQLLLAADRNGSWRAVPPRWRSRSRYPLDGYLVLEDRALEGYVLFPERPDR
jgi:hypothetical protein